MVTNQQKRLYFVSQCFVLAIQKDARAASDWYVANQGRMFTTDHNLRRYRECLGQVEPDLCRMFDMAYEDQCAAACGPGL